MYELKTRNKKVMKKLLDYIKTRKDIPEKLDRLRRNPYKECGAHSLHGPLKGKWACWLGSNLRVIYKIDEMERAILVEDVGTHKIY